MFLDPLQFDFPPLLRCGFATFREELATLTSDDFRTWPQTGAYEGTWQLFALWLEQPPAEFDVDFAANRRRCPASTRYLQRMGRIRSACFSWLGPGAHILSHTDAYYPGVIRAHLGLVVPPQSLMRADVERMELAPEDVIVMDGQTEHEAANLSASPRINLLVDVEMHPHEAEYVMAHSPARRRWHAARDADHAPCAASGCTM